MMSSGTNNKYKTAMCKHFEQTGHCYLGDRCHFAHGKEELRKLTDPLPEGKDLSGPDHKAPHNFQNQGGSGQVPNFKTMKCRFFEKGHCKYEQNCSYAHGDQDLRFPGNVNSQQPGNMQMGNMMSYVDPTQSLYYVAGELEKIHSQDSELNNQIQEAKEALKTGNSQAASSILYRIMDRPEAGKEESQQYISLKQSIQSAYQQQQQVQMMYQNAAYMGMYGYNPQMQAQMMGMVPGMNYGTPYMGGMEGMYQGGGYNNYQNKPYRQNYKNGGMNRGRFNKADQEQGRGSQGDDDKNQNINDQEGGDDENRLAERMGQMNFSNNNRGGRGGYRYGGNNRGGRRFNQNQ